MNTVNSYTVINPYGKEDECAQFTIDDLGMAFAFNEITTPGQDYTFRFWVKSESEGSVITGGSSFPTSSTWTLNTVTFTANSIDFYLVFGVVGTYYIYHPKLEIGNKPTDYTAAPEDTDEQVSQSIADASSETISNCENLINKAGEQYAKTDDVAKLNERIDTEILIDMKGGIEMNFTAITEEIRVTGEQTANDVKVLQNYIHINPEDGSMTFGSSENKITLTLEHDRISFKSGPTEFGYWDGNYFHTGNIVVKTNEKAQLGNFAFVPRNDKSLMFLKVGDIVNV